jgi:hypothetical protein
MEEPEEPRRKISELMKGEGNPFYYNTHSPEVRERLRLANLAKTIPRETRDKISATMGTAVFVYMGDALAYTLTSTRQAASHFNCDHKTIARYVRSGKLFRNQWFLTSKQK